MNKTEFDQDHKIDPHALDVECAQQPELFFKWASLSVEARNLVDRTKLTLEVTEAKLLGEARKDPAAFGLAKVTESGIATAVKLDARYTVAVTAWHDARTDSSMLDKAVMAMEMKKRMLEVLVTLHGQQYFAGPSVPRDLDENWPAQKTRSEKKAKARQQDRTRGRKKKEKK